MKMLNLFLYEFNHFKKSSAKVITYLTFLIACFYSIYNGFELQNSHNETILSIKLEHDKGIYELFNWFDKGLTGPEDKSWIDISNPTWALSLTPQYTIKEPSPLLPLGLGQAEQYGFYKKITNWSSTYDNDMVQELTNPERLVNGNIDFSFLIIFLLPVLLIILIYNIRGLEQDFNFEKLINVQFGSISKWVLIRLSFYVLLLILSVVVIIIGVSLINNVFISNYSDILSLIGLFSGYIFCFAIVFYFIILSSSGSSSIAFKMIGFWLMFCIVIPGSVHQYASIKYPVNYMTDFLDANRKEAYQIYELPIDYLYYQLIDLYPNLSQTIHASDERIDNNIISNSICALVNQLNKNAIKKIEFQNEAKNKLINSSYWFNPVSFIQNKWNSLTMTDYYSYQLYRSEVQRVLDTRIELLVFECWNKTIVNKSLYKLYLKQLNTSKKSSLKANFIDIDEISKSSDDDFYYMIPEKCDVTY